MTSLAELLRFEFKPLERKQIQTVFRDFSRDYPVSVRWEETYVSFADYGGVERSLQSIDGQFLKRDRCAYFRMPFKDEKCGLMLFSGTPNDPSVFTYCSESAYKKYLGFIRSTLSDHVLIRI